MTPGFTSPGTAHENTLSTMIESLITEYGILRPLSRDETLELFSSLDGFEESCNLILAPYLLATEFLAILETRISIISEIPGEYPGWYTLWALVPDRETVVGFLGLLSEPDSSGSVELHWNFNPTWADSPFARESVKTFISWAFRKDDCSRVWLSGGSPPVRDMTVFFRSLGFRKGLQGEKRETFRLSKAVEGRLL